MSFKPGDRIVTTALVPLRWEILPGIHGIILTDDWKLTGKDAFTRYTVQLDNRNHVSYLGDTHMKLIGANG